LREGTVKGGENPKVSENLSHPKTQTQPPNVDEMPGRFEKNPERKGALRRGKFKARGLKSGGAR